MLALLAATGWSQGAASGTVVGATVPSATFVSAAGCPSQQADRTDFGTMLPGSSRVLPNPCVIQFGSSNDTGRLRWSQSDAYGSGMWQATRGALDTSFSGDGVSSIPIAGSDIALDMSTAADGTVVTGGRCGSNSCIARFLPNGTPDGTFDGDGARIVPTATGVLDQVQDTAIRPDGSIDALAKCSTGGAATIDFCIIRLDSLGAPVAGFGTAGVKKVDPSGSNDQDDPNGIEVDGAGRIVVAGGCVRPGNLMDFCVRRYLANGTDDLSFSGDGLVALPITAGAHSDYAEDVKLDAAGRIVVGGSCDVGASQGFCAIRMLDDGTLDPTFDADGIVTYALPGNDWQTINQIELLPDGRILGGGTCHDPVTMEDYCALRINSNGSLDTSLDGDGWVTRSIGPTDAWDQGTNLILMDDGRFIVGGYCDPLNTFNYPVCFVRFRENGALDTTFDSDGILVVPATIGTATGVYGEIGARRPDGAFVTAGRCDPGTATGFDLCLVAYGSSGVPQYADGSNDWDTPGAGFFGACLATVASGVPSIPTNVACPLTDGTYWSAIPTTATQVAVANPNIQTATASFQFGMRVKPDQAPGGYVAPITFDVVAP